LSPAFPALPIGGNWLHEIKHDGFRIPTLFALTHLPTNDEQKRRH